MYVYTDEQMIIDAILQGCCPYGKLKEGQDIFQCPLGFPGCNCADHLVTQRLERATDPATRASK